jgi:heme oxygenase
MATREPFAASNPIIPPEIHGAATPRSNHAILAELKDATSAHHRKLESEGDIWTMLSSPSRYRHLISRMFGIYLPLESRLQSVQGLSTYLPDISRRWKISMLTADLLVLGVDPRSCLEITDTPDFANVAAAFGCLYVLEGSTLGGQFISRQLHAELGLTPENGCRFFSSYGANVGQMWMTFGQALESFAAAHDGCRYEIVESAVATFECFSRGLACKEHPI